MRPVERDDTHFYIDNAPPKEVAWVLRALRPGEVLSPNAIGERLYTEYGFRMQRDKTYSPRRLYDLRLATQIRDGAKMGYSLTELGAKMRSILLADQDLHGDLMHFLHYSTYDGRPTTRKFLWSYRRCSEFVWSEKRVIPKQELAGRILACMKDEFPGLNYAARVGARFDGTAAGRFYTWMRDLSPPPLAPDGEVVAPRISERYELAILALDYSYRHRNYRYGDPVVLDGQLLDELARVFLLEHECCRQLLALAARMTRAVRLRDTFSGTSVTLLVPYGIDSL